MSITARLTVAEYDRMLVAGVFDQGRRVEFIAGEIREMTPIGPEHETIVDRFVRWSYRNVDDASVLIRVQQSLGLPNADSVPQPDVTWVTNADYSRARPTSDDVLLLVEVAESSLMYDLGEKAELYAAAGVRDYWVVDCRNRHVVVHRDPAGARYATVRTCGAGQSLSPLSRPELVLQRRTLFPAAAP